MKVKIAKIVKTRGLKGEVKAVLFSNADDLKKSQIVEVNDIKLSINKVNFVEKFAFLTFNNIDTIEKAEPLVGFDLLIEKESDNDFLYDEELLNCELFIEDKKIGVVKDIMRMHSNINLVIEEESKTIYIPLIKSLIQTIDTNKKIIILNNMEGLL